MSSLVVIIIVSAFRNKGKTSASHASEVCSEACDYFGKLSKYQQTVKDSDLKILEKFVIATHDRSCTVAGVNAA